jgi:hypothetical protein
MSAVERPTIVERFRFPIGASGKSCSLSTARGSQPSSSNTSSSGFKRRGQAVGTSLGRPGVNVGMCPPFWRSALMRVSDHKHRSFSTAVHNRTSNRLVQPWARAALARGTAASQSAERLMSWHLFGFVILGSSALVASLAALAWYCIKYIAKW